MSEGKLWSKLKSSLSVAFDIGTWIHAQLWPIYSTGAILGAVMMVGAIYEKQVLADVTYGKTEKETLAALQTKSEAAVEDETKYAVRHQVYNMTAPEFRQLQAATD
jgi:ABC-type iron transport system FetAB permease component